MHRFRDETGATSVEYGIVAGLVGIAFVAAGPVLWDSLLVLFDTVLDAML